MAGGAACGLAAAFGGAWPRLLRAAENEADKAGELVPFNGKDLSNWKTADPARIEKWKVVSSVKMDSDDPHKLVTEGAGGTPESILFLPRAVGGGDIYTDQTFGDVEVHVEFMIPKGSNSGVYLMGQYECQILDSYGKKNLGVHDCAAIYVTKPPSENACKPPGEWQTYDITFRALRFDAGGKKTENARYVKVVFNGKTVQEDVDTPHPTGGQLSGGEKPKGPLMLQGSEARSPTATCGSSRWSFKLPVFRQPSIDGPQVARRAFGPLGAARPGSEFLFIHHPWGVRIRTSPWP